MNRTVSSSFLAFVLAACGGGSGGGSTGLCDAFCDHELRCDPMATTCERAECDAFEAKVRAEAGAAIAGCFETLACGQGDDPCLEMGIDAVSERPIDEEFATGCNAAVVTCQIGDDLCFASVLFEEELVQEGIDCLDLPCGELDLCLEDVFGL